MSPSPIPHFQTSSPMVSTWHFMATAQRLSSLRWEISLNQIMYSLNKCDIQPFSSLLKGLISWLFCVLKTQKQPRTALPVVKGEGQRISIMYGVKANQIHEVDTMKRPCYGILNLSGEQMYSSPLLPVGVILKTMAFETSWSRGPRDTFFIRFSTSPQTIQSTPKVSSFLSMIPCRIFSRIALGTVRHESARRFQSVGSAAVTGLAEPRCGNGVVLADTASSDTVER